MDGLFISYRREDSAPYAGRLYDDLRRAFPNRHIFMDINAIDPGDDFADAINKMVQTSRVVLAVIGPNWIKATDAAGNRRLDDPEDYVVRELSAALASGARVIPVLVGGASMPRIDSLPPALRALARRNAIELSDTRFIADAERLGAAIARVIDPGVGAGERPAEASVPVSDGDSLTILKAILWSGYGLGIVSIFVQAGKAERGPAIAILVFGALLMGFAAWFNVMLLHGRNWARIAYLALTPLVLPAGFLGLPSQSGAEIALNIVSIALTLWTLRILFTDPIARIFRRPRV